MKYLRRRMEVKPCTDIELTPLKAEIEEAFAPQYIDDDCDTIANHLSPYLSALRKLLNNGHYVDAVTLLIEVLESLTYHFVEDEHYDYFDDMYAPCVR